jgi:hypothetical protein
VSAEVGALRGAADALPVLPGLRLAVRTGDERGFTAGIELASGSTTGFRETTGRLTLGAFAGRARGPWRGELGWRLSGGPITQGLDGGGRFWGWAVGTGPWLGGAVAVSDRLSVIVTAGIDGLLLRRDGGHDLMLAPNGNAGLRVGF